ncbi:MAG: Flagellar protein FliS [Rickettsiaceae bacterium]|nr:Flagellar protein FliS [Rickettsiaceae bacterium]
MASANPFYAYNRAQETKSHTQQIVLLYSAAIAYMQQAKQADKANDHDTRYKLVDKTLSIMRGLRACLDFSANEQVALALNEYYASLENLLITVQTDDNKQELCERIIENLNLIKESWEHINVVSGNDALPPPNDDYGPQDVRV